MMFSKTYTTITIAAATPNIPSRFALKPQIIFQKKTFKLSNHFMVGYYKAIKCLVQLLREHISTIYLSGVTIGRK